MEEDQLSSEEWNKIAQIVSIVKTGYEQIVNDPSQEVVVQEALIKLWHLADNDRYKAPLAHPSLQFLPILKNILSDRHYVSLVFHSLGCLWYMSRKKENDHLIASPELGLVPILMQYLTQYGDDRAYKTLRNCIFHPDNHSYMLSDEIGYVEYWKKEMLEQPLSIDPFHVFAAVGSTMQNETVYLLAKWRIPELVFQRLVSAGVKPSLWTGRDCGIEDHGLTFLTSLSTLTDGRKVLLDLNPFPFLSIVSCSSTIEGIRCLMILFNLCGKEIPLTLTNNIPLTPPSINQQLCNCITRDVYKYYTDILKATISENVGIEASLLQLRGYDYGMFMLRDITLFFLHLTFIYPDIRYFIIQDIDLIRCFKVILNQFIQDKAEFAADNDVAKIFAGGGRDDQDTIQIVLEFFIQLFNLYWEEENIEENNKKDQKKRRANNRESLQWIRPLPSQSVKPVVQGFLKQFEILTALSDIGEVDKDRPLTTRLKQLLEICLTLTRQILEEEQSKTILPRFNLKKEIQRFFRFPEK